MLSLTMCNIKMSCIKIEPLPLSHSRARSPLRVDVQHSTAQHSTPESGVARSRSGTRKAYTGLSQRRQDKQQQRPQPHDSWVSHGADYSEQGRARLWQRFGPAEGKHVQWQVERVQISEV